MGNSWNAQTGVRGRVYNVPRWQVNIPNTACVRNEHPTHRVSSYGHKRPFVAVTLRRKARK